MIDRACTLVPAQIFVGKFLVTFQDFPPPQKAASVSLDDVMEKLEAGNGGNERVFAGGNPAGWRRRGRCCVKCHS